MENIFSYVQTTVNTSLLKNMTETEGFEPSRQSPDLMPFQGILFSHLSISPKSYLSYYVVTENIYTPHYITSSQKNITEF